MAPNEVNQNGHLPTIGYIGLGNAGFSMASNLPKNGYKLIVHDSDSSKAQKAASEWENTTAANGQADAFAECEIIITMLPQGKIVREVLLGTNGIAQALKPGVIVVDTSSSSPYDTRSLGQELGRHQIELVDSPITQTYMHATDAGESTLMVGSDSEEVYHRVRPVLECMAGYLFHMGPLGSGHAMKTLNNYIMASGLIAISDSLITGQKFGLDPTKMLAVLNVGTGMTFSTLDTIRRDGLTKRYNSGFGLGLLVKDLGITEEFMQESDWDTQLPALVKKYLSDALADVEPTADHTKLLVGWEKRAGFSLQPTEEVHDISAEDFEHRRMGINRPQNDDVSKLRRNKHAG